jgi:predicted DCC family thiol-disulfide oxidoreductase YuxK
MASLNICVARHAARKWWAAPVGIFGTNLPPNLLLMAKLIVLAIWLQAELPLSTPFLPFFSFIDRIAQPQVFYVALVTTFAMGTALLFVNWRVREASLALGLTILTSLFASRPDYSNNLAYCGALLCMIGLQGPGVPWLLRLQVAMLYFGAGLNKSLDPDWRSGQFFEYWFGHVHRHELYLRLAGFLPALMLSKVISWIAFSTELSLSALLLVRRFYPLAIWIGLGLHTGMLVMTNMTFRMFFFAACAAYLAFVPWPKDRMTLLYDAACGRCTRVRHFFEAVDLEHRVDWIGFDEANDRRLDLRDPRLRESVHLLVGEKHYSGFAAFRMLVLYNPLTYFALVVILRSPDVLHLRRWIALSAFLLLSPLTVPLGERIYRRFHRQPSYAASAAFAPR